MKKTFFLLASLAGFASLTACDSKTENRMEDQAEKVELHAEMAGDSVLARQAREVRDSVDKADPKDNEDTTQDAQ
ncbi:hypothetical protein [Rufibacter psychrotolerans]|uniref:hypothetical protein n=1 Tax=Rufibacter psychrotolerans TaxID=2812556 RepID=UPI00196817AF|nr:hypothetical protein [Rufibacter sp. SYSU D00308]